MSEQPTAVFEHAWGKSWQLGPAEDSIATYYFEGQAGGASSLHLHERKFNTFIVLSGILELDIDGDIPRRRLYPGQSYTIAPGRAHRMTFVDDARGYEVYHTYQRSGVVDHGDIVRIAPGWTPDGKEWQSWKA